MHRRNLIWACSRLAIALGFMLLTEALPVHALQLAWKSYEGSQFSFDYPAAWELVPRTFPLRDALQVQARSRSGNNIPNIEVEFRQTSWRYVRCGGLDDLLREEVEPIR